MWGKKRKPDEKDSYSSQQKGPLHGIQKSCGPANGIPLTGKVPNAATEHRRAAGDVGRTIRWRLISEREAGSWRHPVTEARTTGKRKTRERGEGPFWGTVRICKPDAKKKGWRGGGGSEG